MPISTPEPFPPESAARNGAQVGCVLHFFFAVIVILPFELA
jgi:hypothetical protein